MLRITTVSLFICIFSIYPLLASCGNDSLQQDIHEVEFLSDFQYGLDGWQVGFADYPVGEELFYELQSSWQTAPPSLGYLNALLVSGNNHSDDLFMFIKKQIQGLPPSSRYEVRFELTIATNAARDCMGVGGPPGEGVFIKAGASSIEPISEDIGTAYYLMNIDKGNQSVTGNDAINVGDFAGTKTDCFDTSYEKKLLTSDGQTLTVESDDEGKLWLMFGTDSGFEATTAIYYLASRVVLTEVE